MLPLHRFVSVGSFCGCASRTALKLKLNDAIQRNERRTARREFSFVSLAKASAYTMKISASMCRHLHLEERWVAKFIPPPTGLAVIGSMSRLSSW